MKAMKTIPTKFAIYHARQLYRHLDDPGGEYLNNFIQILSVYGQHSRIDYIDLAFFQRTLQTAVTESGYEEDNIIWVNFIDSNEILQALNDWNSI